MIIWPKPDSCKVNLTKFVGFVNIEMFEILPVPAGYGAAASDNAGHATPTTKRSERDGQAVGRQEQERAELRENPATRANHRRAMAGMARGRQIARRRADSFRQWLARAPPRCPSAPRTERFLCHSGIIRPVPDFRKRLTTYFAPQAAGPAGRMAPLISPRSLLRS